MDTIKFTCGQCYQKTEAPENLSGKIAYCNSCNARIVVPENTKEVKKKSKFSLEMAIFNTICFIGAIFSILYFIAGLGQGSIMGEIGAILSAMLFFIIIASNKIVVHLREISQIK